MNADQILLLILIIVSAGFIFNQTLEWINIRNMKTEIPEDVAGFYDHEKYLLSQDYHRARTKFDFWSSLFSLILTLIILISGTFGWLDAQLRNYFSGNLMLAFSFFGIILLTSEILSLPFSWYSTFVIEERFGFNKTTSKTFFLDKIKGLLLGALIGAPLYWLFIKLLEWMGSGFWIWFGLVAGLFMLLMNMFYTSWLLPLFNRLTPLEDGELKSAIVAYAEKVNFPITQIMVMDGSKRSSKANAFFSGIGKSKKVVLFDTLIEKHTTEELVAVLAHEVGHYKKRHLIAGLALAVGQIFFTLWMLSYMIFNPELSHALGGNVLATHLNLIAFGILFSPISAVTGLFSLMLSRKNEFEADAYAGTTYNAKALATALKKLSVDTLSNLFPNRFYVFFHYSHPPLLQRLRQLNT
jgi:STE24 endopeptidase